ncbi:hypothetical protein CU098_008517 [Rhizopus stolonifer]|uniref:F-box domain-containing protein n=1 Tax=Rhizopus stolonifer TaxID=4846 RepID=A0A367KTZ8_RHIST|nr:hypothetical protein CU098_008517 [Rhizopus stolonifer]
MNKIPVEVFCQITSYLTYSEKQKLLLICHYWHDIIKNTNLFHSFSVKGRRKFEAAIANFKTHILYQRQVKSLRLTRPEVQLHELLELPVLFPYLSHLTWQDYSNQDYANIELGKSQIQHWQKLKSFEEINRFAFSLSLLREGLFTSLVQIKINFFMGYNNCNDLFDYLPHAPNLKRLDLICISITLELMEKLHTNASQLDTLFLTDVLQASSGFDTAYETEQQQLAEIDQSDTVDMQVRKTQPAIYLQKLRLKQFRLENDDLGLESRWMTYISNKYTQLKHLTIYALGAGRSYQPYYEQKLGSIVSSLSQLESYDVNLYPLTKHILIPMDQSSTTLKKVNLLDDISIQLSTLVESQQKEYIETITLRSDLLNSEIFVMLEQFSQLRRLTIESSSKLNDGFTVPLDTVLQGLTQLEELTLLYCNITLDRPVVNPEKSKLKSLVMERAMMMNVSIDIMSFIAQTCPFISELVIQGKVKETGHGPLQVHFPEQYFRSIKLYILGNQFYKVSNGSQVMWYTFCGKTLLSEQIEHKDQFYVSIAYKGASCLKIQGVNIPC